jgi:CRP-like cAMP-binding protein
MYIQHADLFRGMSKDFLKKVMDITTKESHEKGAILFREGDPAVYLFALLQGRVDLSIGEMGHVVFVVSRPGEAFGWSSLISRDLYSATAECKVPTRLLKMEREKWILFFQAPCSHFGKPLASELQTDICRFPSGDFTFIRYWSSPSVGGGSIGF